MAEIYAGKANNLLPQGVFVYKIHTVTSLLPSIQLEFYYIAEKFPFSIYILNRRWDNKDATNSQPVNTIPTKIIQSKTWKRRRRRKKTASKPAHRQSQIDFTK